MGSGTVTMSTLFQSFVRSPLGAFIKSPLGMRGQEDPSKRWWTRSDTTSPYQIALSPDGATWTLATKSYPPQYPLWYFNNRVFGYGAVTGGGYYYWRSRLDPMTWTGIIPDSNTSRRDWGDGMFRLASGRIIFFCPVTQEIWASDDGGDSFTLKHTFSTTSMHLPLRVLASGRLITGALKAAGSFMYYSDNGGTTWTEVQVDATKTHTVNYALLLDSSNYLWLCNRYGTSQVRYKSIDEGVSWVLQAGTIVAPPSGNRHNDAWRLASGRQIVVKFSTYTAGSNPSVLISHTDDNGANWNVGNVGQSPQSYTGGPVRKYGADLYRPEGTAIKKSSDGVNWSTIGTVSGGGIGLCMKDMVSQ